uniref:Macaca fascicularis brain cDNA clone: QccE-17904, similar to human potassium voltage-gated channel, shaker-relatedsubfamily, beta member 2 (KCNAB2), transcript variant 2, mRNA, RefSeq: NM_172130.1 n=1 Tax=Macaca fascicularis TaxID=9541 RepID=I7G425_MACFA|nr:unnamed protein product [Macaca fascicularis]
MSCLLHTHLQGGCEGVLPPGAGSPLGRGVLGGTIRERTEDQGQSGSRREGAGPAGCCGAPTVSHSALRSRGVTGFLPSSVLVQSCK